MTYIVTEDCIRCKYMDCIEVCPVDCFYEGENMLVIHPDECIDCGVCEPECPPEAILPDTDPKAEAWLEVNREYSDGPGPTSPAKATRLPMRMRTRGWRISTKSSSARSPVPPAADPRKIAGLRVKSSLLRPRSRRCADLLRCGTCVVLKNGVYITS